MSEDIKASLNRAIIDLGIFSFVSNMLLLVQPLYMLQIYDRVLSSGSVATLTYISVAAALSLVVLGIIEIARAIYANRVASQLEIAIGPKTIMASFNSPRASLGDIQPLRDLSGVRSFISSRTVFALFDLPFAPIFIGLTYLIHPLLFWMTVGGAVILTILAIANQYATSKAGKESGDHAMNALISAQSFVRSTETLRAMGMIGNAIGAWGKHEGPHLARQDDVARINAIFSGISKSLRMGLQVAILGVGGYLVLQGEITAGMIFASSLIAGRGLQPIDQVIGGWKQFVDAYRAWERVNKAAASVEQTQNPVELPAPKGSLEAENIVYFLPNTPAGADPLLKRVSFRLNAGDAVAVIGPSGAGKSTLARVLVGAVPARTGVIRLDGGDIRNWDPEKLGKHLGYLAQEADILPGTIAQNIARFDPEATSEAIVQAAQKAQVHDLILKLPAGYDTQIGPSGITLSGGQKQRVGLARAFFGNPKLLVLDEPNANLDSEGEAALERALDEAKADGATVVIVTQRRSVAAKVDKILLMLDGRVDDFGPRDEVLARQAQKNKPRGPEGAGDPKAGGPQPAPAPMSVMPMPNTTVFPTATPAAPGMQPAAAQPAVQPAAAAASANAPLRAGFGAVTRVKGN